MALKKKWNKLKIRNEFSNMDLYFKIDKQNSLINIYFDKNREIKFVEINNKEFIVYNLDVKTIINIRSIEYLKVKNSINYIHIRLFLTNNQYLELDLKKNEIN